MLLRELLRSRGEDVLEVRTSSRLLALPRVSYASVIVFNPVRFLADVSSAKIDFY